MTGEAALTLRHLFHMFSVSSEHASPDDDQLTEMTEIKDEKSSLSSGEITMGDTEASTDQMIFVEQVSRHKSLHVFVRFFIALEFLRIEISILKF